MKRIKNASETVLTTHNGAITVHVPGPNAVQNVRTITWRGTNGAAQALMVAKNITLEPRSHRASYTHLRSVPLYFHFRQVSHLCNVTNGNTSRFLPFNAGPYNLYNASHGTHYVPPCSTGTGWNGKRNATVWHVHEWWTFDFKMLVSVTGSVLLIFVLRVSFNKTIYILSLILSCSQNKRSTTSEWNTIHSYIQRSYKVYWLYFAMLHCNKLSKQWWPQ